MEIDFIMLENFYYFVVIAITNLNFMEVSFSALDSRIQTFPNDVEVVTGLIQRGLLSFLHTIR